MTRRTEQIGEQLRGEIARLIREEVTDPRVVMLSLTRVDVAPDLSQALVFWSPLQAGIADDPAQIEAIGQGLASAASFMRRRISKLLPLRRSPALEFRHDPSLELGSRTLDLLRDVRADDATKERGSEDE